MQVIALETKIPDPILPYPKAFWDRAKYFFWKALTPGFLFGLNALLRLRILRHAGRQDFVLGRLAPDRKLEYFIQHLNTQGFYNHFVAWHDDGQIVSLRKLENFEWQYHLRIFSDREIRGHYEYTPESHPILHIKEVRMEDHRKDFLRLLGDWIVR